MENKCVFILIGLTVGVLLLLLVILLPMAFSYVEFHQYGLAQQKSTGVVNLDTIYTEGRYLHGPDYDFLLYQADAHSLDLVNIDVFTHDKLEVKLTAHMQYFLRKDELQLIHKQFNVYYSNVVRSSAIDALKGAIPIYSTRELISNRSSVEAALYHAVRQRVGGICCRPDCEEYVAACPVGCKERSTCVESDYGIHIDVKYFQLAGINIPGDVETRYMEALVQLENKLRSDLVQDVKVIRKETDKLVKDIKNDANELTQNATAHANLVRNIGWAKYNSELNKARIIGLEKMFTFLNISDEKIKTSYNYLRALDGNNKVRLTVDFDQKIVGTV